MSAGGAVWRRVGNVKGAPGVEGPVSTVPGPPGPPGPPAAPSVYIQISPAATWTIQHTLPWARPEVSLFLDEAPDQEVFTDVSYPDSNTIVIELPEPATGTAYLR